MAELVYPPVIGLARVVFAFQGLRFDAAGDRARPAHGGAVMAINHVGYLDFTYAGLAGPPGATAGALHGQGGGLRPPVSGPLMRGMHHIPVDREAGAGVLPRRARRAAIG